MGGEVDGCAGWDVEGCENDDDEAGGNVVKRLGDGFAEWRVEKVNGEGCGGDVRKIGGAEVDCGGGEKDLANS